MKHTDETMLAVLRHVERSDVMWELLRDVKAWKSLDVKYDPPRVERLWRPFEDCRIYIHRIHPCERALFHPHPWPSAVHILSGHYEMEVGYGSGKKAPPVASKIVLASGSYYTMTDPNGWHSVRPLLQPSLSLMVTGPRWRRWSPSPDFKLKPMKPAARMELYREFKNMFFGASGIIAAGRPK